MTPQQAGVSALAAAAQAVIDSYKADGPGYPPTFGRPKIRAAWDNLKAALATAPPEQAAPVKSTLPVGVSVLVTNGELVLLGERINNTASGLLSTPGGRIEQNEDIFACAVRETQEETGLSLTRDLLKVIAWREHFRFGQHYIMFYVHAPQSFGTIANKEPDKCKSWGWRTISQIKAEETTEPLDILALLAQPQAVSAGALSAVLASGKIGWMDSTDFSCELGHALGGNKIFPDAEDCKKNHLCIEIPDAAWPCKAQRVIVFDADEFEAALAAHDQKVRDMRSALEALAEDMEAGCGDHCPNNCRMCIARSALRLILCTPALAAPAPAASKPEAGHE